MRGRDEEGEKRGDEEDTAARGGAMGGRRGRSVRLRMLPSSVVAARLRMTGTGRRRRQYGLFGQKINCGTPALLFGLASLSASK